LKALFGQAPVAICVASMGLFGGDVSKDDKFQKGGKDDISSGPVKSRHCTDLPCCVLYIAHWFVFAFVTILGVQDGNPAKLYMPRDYRGSYCGAATNWNGGPDLEAATKSTYMMNTTATTDMIAKQLLCSSASSSALQALVTVAGNWTAALNEDYLCACCLTPCGSCVGSLDVGGDLDMSSLGGTIGSRMGDLTSTDSAGDLFSPSGANGDLFANMWSEATKYFVQVCLPSCATDSSTIAALNETGSDALRSFKYDPDGDNPLLPAWNALSTIGPAAIKSVLESSFTFQALPRSTCNYDPRYCVPFPGIQFVEVNMGYCTFEMAGAVISSIGSSAAGAMTSLGADSMASSATSSFGSNVGDFMDSLDTFVLVGFTSFIVGILFMIFLRMFIGCCVWFAVFCVLLAFAFGGGLCYVRSFQCAGASLLGSGQQAAVAVTVVATSTALNAANGVEAPSELLEGDGGNYTGVQMRTRSGKLCQAWSVQTPNAHTYTAANYPDSNLRNNYCRNPYNVTDRYKANTIWCITTDSTQVWELCSPIGVIKNACDQGYAVSSQTFRDILEKCSYIIWALGAVWIILVICFRSRIQLAIALNKVAAEFVMHNVTVLAVPIVQVIIGLMWIIGWMASASFLLSQVSDGYTPKGYYATYAEAYGIDGEGFTSGTPGACTDKWPTGFVWKDSDCLDGKCWRCAPPRYVLDVRFAISFFSFLWNNAFLIAAGQCIIAGAVGAWFFTPNAEKGKKSTTMIGVRNTFRYHLGSIAFGSLIIAIIQFIRYVMKYFEKQAEAQKNMVMKYILKCLQCCMWCFEKCMKFLNKNAYIQIALLGTPFCTSAKKAFFLILRNALRFATVAILSGVINSIGFICITVGTAVLGYIYLNAMHPEISPLFPLFVYTCVGYVVGKLYMNVFGLAVDTSLQCVIAAEELNHNGDFVPKALKNFLPPAEKKDDVQRWAGPKT